jgi:hypothetical protein
MGALRAGLDAALSGRGGLALVSGEPGIGKSAVVAALAREAEARGAVVTWGRAWEFADSPPYFPLWPCFRSLGIESKSEHHDESNSFYLWEKVVTSLADVAESAPRVWILEDLHAADLGTLDLLTFIAQPVRTMRALVVGTVRAPDPRLTDRVTKRLTRIARDGIDLGLAPLPQADVAAITEAAIGRRVSEPDLRRLVDLTGGNPLFVVECARAFRAAGGVEGTLRSLPPTVRQVVLDRFGALPESAREALAHGAVLGREFLASSVASMSNSLPARVIDALLPALRAGFVTELSPGRFALSHAIVRDAIEDALDPNERARLHGLAEAALRASGDTADILVERARHALWALRSGAAVANALDLARRAGALLERDGAFDRAFELCARLEETREAGFLPPAPLPEKLAMARIARAAGRSDAARTLCEGVIASARAIADVETLARAVLLHAADVRPGFIDRLQVAQLEEARDALGAAYPELRCRILARLATALQPARDLSIPHGLTREAIHDARATGDSEALLDVLELAPWGLYGGPLEERMANAAELCEGALAKDDLTKAIFGHVMLALYRIEASDFDAFGLTVEALLTLSDAVGHPRHRWRALLLASMRATMLGHFAEAERYVTEVTQLAALIDEPALAWTLGLHELFRARAERRDEDVSARLAGLDERHRHDVDGALFAALNRAACTARREDVAATRAALAPIGSRASMFFVDPGPAAFLAEAYAVAGTDEERRAARDVLRAPRPSDLSGEVMSFVYEGTVGRIVGLLDAALGDVGSAERELRQAYATAVARKHSPWIAQTGYELAKVLRRAGRGEEARELMTESAQLARELGMPGLERRAAAELSKEGEVAGSATSLATRVDVTFEKSGAEYRVARGTASVVLKDSRGAQLLARLVANPLEEIHVLALASDEPVSRAPESTAGEMLDDAAKRAYRQRLSDLERDLEEAEHHADMGRVARLRREKEALVKELTRAIGIGGRARQAGSATERARVNVQRRLKDAIAKIAEADGELGRFFEQSVRTGTYCCFRPR